MKKSKKQPVLTRPERFWFAFGSLLFGLNGVPVVRRPVPKTTKIRLPPVKQARAALKAVKRMDTNKNEATVPY